MQSGHDQVEGLLRQLRRRARDPEVRRLSEQISVLCWGYMAPCEDVLPNVKLSPNERKLFALLHARLGRAVGRGALLDAASYHHGWDREPLPKVVDVYICHLRRKLKGSDFAIETVWGLGYRLVQMNPHASTGSA
jgi:DNA-binding response OmpR family regulator